jgi:hypothetical protein
VVFFKAQAQSLQPIPQRVHADGDLQLARAALLQLRQCEIGLLLDPVQKRAVMGRQLGDAITTLSLGLDLRRLSIALPVAFHRAHGDVITTGHQSSALPCLPSRDDLFA